MQRIWKYALMTPSDQQSVSLPIGAKVLCVQMQHGLATVWALVEEDAGVGAMTTFYMFGTGHPIPLHLQEMIEYVGTVQQDMFVWHVFKEVTE